MKKTIFLLLFLVFLTPFLMAQTSRQDRRIEEEKRQSLKGTLEYLSGEQTLQVEPGDEFDVHYFQKLFMNRVAFRYDACKTLIMMMGLEGQYSDIDSQIAFLIENGIAPKALAVNFNVKEPLRKGEAAYMFCKALKIKGGLWMRIFGFSQRYALKELVYQGIMLPGSISEIISGKELILMLTESARYITEEMGGSQSSQNKEDNLHNES